MTNREFLMEMPLTFHLVVVTIVMVIAAIWAATEGEVIGVLGYVTAALLSYCWKDYVVKMEAKNSNKQSADAD